MTHSVTTPKVPKYLLNFMLFVPALRHPQSPVQRAVPDDLPDNPLEIPAATEEAILTETMKTTAMPMVVLVVTANHRILRVIPVSPDPQMVMTQMTTTKMTTSPIAIVNVKVSITY